MQNNCNVYMKVLDASFCGGYNNGRKVATYDAARAQRHDDGKDGGRMSRLIGIDLGTTNSCVAVMDGGSSVVIPSETGARTTPSVVAFMKDGTRLVGEAARRQAVLNPARTVYSIKREMGSNTRIKIDGKSYSPPEISAMILSKLKTDAENYLGEPVADAVITVPAYFTDSQRQATRDAGTIAGLNVVRIVNEPTAAALAYGVDKEQSQKVMVYDLGGGTFDVSVLDIQGGVIEVLATAGNNRLGGDDFDKAVADYLAEEFKRTYRLDPRKDQTAFSRLREAAEQAKIELSSVSETHVSIPFLMQKRGTPCHLDLTLTREKFDELTRPLIEATLGPVRQAMDDAKVTPAALSKVLLVGGSTRIPAVQEAVKAVTGKEPFKGINPDECVAIGASLQAGVLAGAVHGLLLLDVTPLTLGIETMGGVFSPIISRNTTIPVKKTAVYTTAANFQTSVEIKVFQGERQMTRGNKLLGNFRLNGITRAPRGVPQIEVTFEIDASGIVHVTARDQATGRAQDITITASGNLSREEIDRAVADARAYAGEDRLRRRQAAARDAAEAVLYKAEAADRKSMSREEKKRLDEAEKRLRKALRGRDAGEMEQAAEEMKAVLQR